MEFDSKGKPRFVDKSDKDKFDRILALYYNKGVQRFVLSLDEFSGKKTSEKQVNLWNVVKRHLADNSGNDLQTIEETLNDKGKSVSDMSNKEFSDLLEHAFSISYEYFNVRLTFNEETNTIEILNENNE